jgi:hypothetical protein
MYITDTTPRSWHKGMPTEEDAMKARVLIESASLGPDDLKSACQAFDVAWEKIAGRYKSANAIEAARMQLATLILSLGPDTKDANEMQAIAVQEMMTDD